MDQRNAAIVPVKEIDLKSDRSIQRHTTNLKVDRLKAF